MSEPLQLLIPAAGKGSRFTNAGFDFPKPIIPVWDIPMLIWVISNFPLEPEDQIRILCQSEHEIPGMLKNYVKKLPNQVKFLEIDYWTEGPAHSVELLLEGINDSSPVVCANSDQYVFSGLPEFVNAVRNGKSQGQILTMEATSNAWSYIGRDSDGKVIRVVEKEEISNEATVGVYGWSSAATLRAALSWQRDTGLKVNNEYYVAPSYQFLIENRLEISTHSVGLHGVGVHGLGVPKDLENFLTLETAMEIHGRLSSIFF